MSLVFATTFFFGGGVLRHSAVQTDFEYEISGSLGLAYLLLIVMSFAVNIKVFIGLGSL